MGKIGMQRQKRQRLVLPLLGILAMTAVAPLGAQHKQVTEPVVHYTFDDAGNITSRTVAHEPILRPTDDSIIAPPLDTFILYYPNPVRLRLTAEAVDYAGEFPIHYELYDEGGSLIRSLSATSALTEIEMGELPPGMYIVRGIRGDTVISGQILKIE